MNKKEIGHSEIITCKVCNQDKERILTNVYTYSYGYRDANGEGWNGKVCPQCFKHQKREDSKQKTKIKQEKAKKELFNF